MKTTGKKKDGFLQLLKPIEVEKFLDNYNENQHFDVEIITPDKKMSDRHRKFYFAGCIKPASEYFKIDRTDLHNYFKNLLLMELNEIRGSIFPTFPKGREFRKLSSKAMTEYVKNVRAELRSPDNIFSQSFDTIDPDEYWALRNDGVLL